MATTITRLVDLGMPPEAATVYIAGGSATDLISLDVPPEVAYALKHLTGTVAVDTNNLMRLGVSAELAKELASA